MNDFFLVLFYCTITSIAIFLIPVILHGIYMAFCAIYKLIIAFRYGMHRIAFRMAIETIKGIINDKRNQNGSK